MNWLFQKTKKYVSALNGEITIAAYKGNQTVFSGGVTQSGGEIQPMWEEVIDKLYQTGFKPKKILILGVAGGSVIQAIRQHDKTTNMLGIEIDPVMKQVAMEQFHIHETSNQKILIADAIHHLLKETKEKSFDMIIVDLYIGRLNPEKSRTKKFLERLKMVTKPKGIILYNAHYQKKNTGEYEAFRKLTDKIFRDVEEVFSYPLNRVLQLYS